MTRTRRPRRKSALLAAVAAISLTAGAAFAQEQAPDGRTIYPAAWFERFAPSNAWDMASQVPGLSVQDGEEVRGFAGAAGNVVINGARPSAKAEKLEAILRRIPAAQVVRVEVVPGQLIGGEYRARAQVLNIVLTEEASGWSGSVEATARYPDSGQTSGSGGVSVLHRKGAHAFSLAATHHSEHLPDEGFDLLTLRPSGALVERRDKINRYYQQEDTLSASWAWEPSDGRAAHLNGRTWSWSNPLFHRSEVTGPGGPLRFDTIDQAPERTGFEIGGDVSRPLAGGTAKLVGLVRRERSENAEVQLRRTSDGGPLIDGFSQSVDNLYGETVGRATWSRENLFGWSVETGGEAALNTLDASIDVAVIDASGGVTPIVLPGSKPLVEEVRGEVFLSAGRSLTPTLTFDWGAAVETSTLSVSGEGIEANERTLTFLKPRASIEWRPSDTWRLRLAAGRTVAQLNFDDFVSNVELANDRDNAGNKDLEPERTWRLTGEIERKVLGDGTLRLALHSDWVQMVQDRVPVEVLGPDGPDPDSEPDVIDVVDAPGNLGDGRRLWLEAAAGLPLDRFGVKGGRFNLRWVLQDSRVRDPYTGRDREFTYEEAWNVAADFRQDLREHNLAWGVVYDAEGVLPQYRINEVDDYNPENYWFRVFIEARPNPKTTITLSANNVLDRAIVRDRVFYDPTRATPEPFADEHRWRRQGVTWALQVKRTFG